MTIYCYYKKLHFQLIKFFVSITYDIIKQIVIIKNNKLFIYNNL